MRSALGPVPIFLLSREGRSAEDALERLRGVRLVSGGGGQAQSAAGGASRLAGLLDGDGERAVAVGAGALGNDGDRVELQRLARRGVLDLLLDLLEGTRRVAGLDLDLAARAAQAGDLEVQLHRVLHRR